MNFGQNLYDWFISNAQPLVLLALAGVGLYLIFKRETSKLIGFVVLGVVAVLLVFNTSAVQNFLFEVGNRILGS